LATKEAFDGTNRIVLIEDVDEHPHRIDAMLTHLLNSGVLAQARGLVIGEMTRTDETSDPTIGAKPWSEIVAERLAPLGLPTVVGYPFGHQSNMQSLLLGVAYTLDAAKGTLLRSSVG
jgi:muramoyltetrapeptide carboxypeptidase